MPLEYPTFENLVEIARAALINEIPSLDPTISNSWARAFVDSLAAVAHSNNLQIRDLEKELFPQTATSDYLDRWLQYEGLERLAPTAGRGVVTITGTAGSIVPVLTNYTGTNGLTYQNQTAATIASTVLSVLTLTRSGTTATATFASSHGLATGNSVTVAGATPSDYNGTFTITAISDTSITYTVTGSPTTPATGTITCTGTYASVVFECTTTGATTNIDSSSTLTIDTPISGVDDSAIIGPDGLTGGADQESNEAARTRLFLSRSSISGVFTPAQIKTAALAINGNTRVWVVEPENPAVAGGPEPGQVFVYFTRDNDSNPLPSTTIVAETKAAIIANGAKPAHTADIDVVVASPTAITTNFTFASISPDTASMRTAIEAQLKAFFEDSASVGEDVKQSSYLGAIANTYDTTNAVSLTSFSLSSPSADIAVTLGELAFLGTVSFP